MIGHVAGSPTWPQLILRIRFLACVKFGCATSQRTDAAFVLKTRTYVWIKIPGVCVRKASIIWCKENRYGCEFGRPLRRYAVDPSLPESQWSAQ